MTIASSKAGTGDTLTPLRGIVKRLRAKVSSDERHWHILPLVGAAEKAIDEGRALDAASYVIQIEQALDAWPSGPMAWNILLVSPHFERRVRDTLAEAGLQVYVPIETRWPRGYLRMTKAEKARAKPITRPLIPGLVFALLPDDDAINLVNENKAARLLKGPDGPVKVRARDIGAMVLFEACHEFDETWEPPNRRNGSKRGKRRKTVNTRWKGGERVKVTEGPFAGFFGEVLRASREDRVEVLVTIFGRSTPVDLGEGEVQDAPDQDRLVA